MKISEVINSQVKAKDKKPALVKPTRGPEQKHPFRGKLVGEEVEAITKEEFKVGDMVKRKGKDGNAMQGEVTKVEDDRVHVKPSKPITKKREYNNVFKKDDVERIKELAGLEEFDEAAGEKDACYHKVKSRYKVWPSAYASGALVKCRKVGAKNWGNKSK